MSLQVVKTVIGFAPSTIGFFSGDEISWRLLRPWRLCALQNPGRQLLRHALVFCLSKRSGANGGCCQLIFFRADSLERYTSYHYHSNSMGKKVKVRKKSSGKWQTTRRRSSPRFVWA